MNNSNNRSGEHHPIFRCKPYKKLLSYQRADVVYRATVKFTERFLGKGDRTVDQMIQAARSCKQNIVEGAMASAGSKQTELFLTSVALASLTELLEDYEDFLNTHDAVIWTKNSREAVFVRNLCRQPEADYELYREFIETRPAEIVANIILTVIHQTSYLLNRQIESLEKKFLKEGGIKEKMTTMRLATRNQK